MAKIRNTISKRKIFFRSIILLLLVSLVALFYHSSYIAPMDYKITTKTISSKQLPDTFSNFKIAFLSDIHLQDKDDIIRFQEVATTINKQSFDMVIFGGDLYDDTPFNTREVAHILKSITSTSGKFAVQGEKDVLHSNDVISILSDGGFEVLHNEYRKIYYQDTVFALFGLESNGDIAGLLNENNQEMFKLVVVHEPDYFSKTIEQNIDLQLSGHSLGGYIYIPIVGPLYTKTNAKTFVNGTHKKNESTLIISNGLGLESSHSYRLFCPNEIVSISLKGNKETTTETE